MTYTNRYSSGISTRISNTFQFDSIILAHMNDTLTKKRQKNLKWFICIFFRVAGLPEWPCVPTRRHKELHIYKNFFNDPQLQAQKHTHTHSYLSATISSERSQFSLATMLGPSVTNWKWVQKPNCLIAKPV